MTNEVRATRVAVDLHELGMKSGECRLGASEHSDHGYELHLPDARYIVGFLPVSNPDHLEDLNRGGEELRALRRRFDANGTIRDA